MRYVKILDNDYRNVELLIQESCDLNQVQEISYLKSNLNPDSWDVDIDMANINSGFQFDPVSSVDEFDVIIRFNAQPGSLITFSLKIW